MASESVEISRGKALLHSALRRLALLIATLLLGGLLGATLVRIAPGFGLSAEQLDPRLSSESVRALREAQAGERNVLIFYTKFLVQLLKGDLGVSQTLNRPVTELLRDRVPVTVTAVGWGMGLGWLLGFSLAATAWLFRSRSYDLLATTLGGVFLCLPTAALALLFLLIGAPGRLAVALVVFPNVFRYVRNLLEKSGELPHIITARAKGLGPARVLFFHVLPPSAPELFALLGVSVSIALGASIPIEAIADLPGIGQLAWQAALGRDLPLLVNLTLIVTAVTLLANWTGEVLAQAFRSTPA
ncbi:MAG: ABC transporter permease [Acidobacteriales bacterium]|nr:ABC transporter permease [Terriglobales bacterium]